MSSLVQNMVMQFLKWRYNFMKGLSEKFLQYKNANAKQGQFFMICAYVWKIYLD